jgi:fatty-acyl-CoA synthase
LATCCTGRRSAFRTGWRWCRATRERLTWAELSDEADRVARGLWSLGIRRGDRVGLWSTNCIEWIVMHMGCARAGAALVNVNPAYRSHELQFTLTRSRG